MIEERTRSTGSHASFLALVAILISLPGLSGCVGGSREPIEPAPSATSPDVPEWAKDAVWYQIFPERFRNGDPSNDPTVDVVADAWPYARPEGWAVTPWTSDWYARAEWEATHSDDFYVTVQARRYGGDLAGIIEALPYLDSLGVTAIYLNPVFDAPSLHKYDGSTFHHIDVHFGPDPVGDRALIDAEDPTDPATWTWTAADRQFLELVGQVHARGMRIILDGVFNHMGLQSFPFLDVVKNQQASRFADWIDVVAWDDPATAENEFDYRGWVGVKSLPELTEDDHGLLPPIRDYVFASVARWMDPDADGNPSDGIDGWRLDVSEWVAADFWRAFRTHVRSINPDAYIVGEYWWEDWQNHVMFDASPKIQGDQYDAVMNYRWALPARRLFIGADLEPGQTYTPSRFLGDLAELRAMYPPEAQAVMMNTYGSHDTDRPASQVANPNTFFDHAVNIRENPDYVIRRPSSDEWATLRMMLVHQFTYIGAPHLFYGDEAGMWGGDDPDERKPMVWPDLTYDDEAGHPLGGERTPDPVVFDRTLFDFFRTLIDIRKAHPALRRGTFDVTHLDDASGTFAYRRTFGPDHAWVVFNVSRESLEVTMDTGIDVDGHEGATSPTRRVDLLSGEAYDGTDGALRISLAPRTAAIIVVPES